MPNPARDKGLRAERELVALLADLTGWRVSRIPRPGAQHDEGDLFGLPDCVAQVADWEDVPRAVRRKPDEAERQRVRASVPFAISFVRLRGGVWRAVLTPEQAMALLREATTP